MIITQCGAIVIIIPLHKISFKVLYICIYYVLPRIPGMSFARTVLFDNNAGKGAIA